MDATFTPLLTTIASEPLWLALALFTATFVVEDLATIAAGIVVARTGADPLLPMIAVILGTGLGDMGLYALGRWGSETKMGRRLRARRAVSRAEIWMRSRALPAVFAARFMPGFRLPVFTASGLVKAPVLPVALIVSVTTPVWIGLLFEVARTLGRSGATALTHWALPAGLALAVVAMILGQKSHGEKECSTH